MDDGQRQNSFEALLAEHRKIVFKVAATFAREAEDREDLAQEIVVQLWRSFDRYDEGRSKFSTWMYRIALNVAISQLRRNRGSLVGDTESLDDHHLERIANKPANEADERVAALRSLIDRLDALSRALMLLYLEERGYTEIAEILGITETNVATKINRLKQKLRLMAAEAGMKGA
jgi:RNA polymerase sigma-70 factor (ECF subfamily)